MWPEYMPVFTADDILISENNYENNDGRKTTVGWLKHLFLYTIMTEYSDCIQITPENRKIYCEVLDKFRQINRIEKGMSLDNWEDHTSRSKQAVALNNLRKSLGYTVIK